MTRPYNAAHPDRAGRHSYSKRKKTYRADKYGYFVDGDQKSSDRVAGRTLWYPKEDVNQWLAKTYRS